MSTLSCRRDRARFHVTATVALASLIGLLVSGLFPILTRAQDVAWTPPQTVFISSAGHTVDGLFLDLWRDYPTILGNPVTEEFKTKSGLGDAANAEQVVQYFEGVALVYLPDLPVGDQVATLPIGREAAKILAPAYREAFKAVRSDECGAMDTAVCTVFGETKHSLRFGFKVFWDKKDGAELLGPPLSEQFTAADGRQVQLFERGALQWKRGEDITARPIGKQLAERQKLDMKPVARPDDVPVYDDTLFVEPEPAVVEADVNADQVEAADTDDGAETTDVGGVGPGPVQGGNKEIVVSISAQRMWAYEDGETILTTLVSTGTAEIPFTTTPVGQWSVLVKYDVQTMEGTVSGEAYRVPDVPWVMYFDNSGNALHGTYWHNNFGTPMSHGCVNLPMDVAEFLYGWAPVGTAVTVVE